MEEKSIGAMFLNQAEKLGGNACIMEKKEGRWKESSWNEVAGMVKDLGLAMMSLGVEPGDRVAIFSPNSLEWKVTDLASLSIGAADVTLYATLTPSQAEYILKDSGSKMAFVGTLEHLERVLGVKGNLPELVKIVTMDNAPSDDPMVMTFDEMLELGRKQEDREAFDLRLKAAGLDDLASIIYTSGTTGNPKGVMLTHNNLLSNCKTAAGLADVSQGEVGLSFLPFSHSFERTVGYYLAVAVGLTVAHAESIDKLVDNIGEVKPHYMASVPRLYEKFHAGVVDMISKESPVKQKIFKWAVATGRKVSALKVAGKPVPALLEFKYGIADKLVFSKIKERMGGRLRFFMSGGAPLAKEIAEFFHAMGILILEGYGLTETSPIITCNLPDAVKFGTVGRAIPGVEVKIAEDGEILSRGPNIMKGYWNREEDTREVMDGDWFRTGDIGEIDSDGFLKITDRKKDIIVTAGGKNVAPQNIENQLKLSRYIEQAAVIGDKRKYLSALIVPSFEALSEFCKEKGIPSDDPSAMVSDPRVEGLYRGIIDDMLKEFAPYERIAKFTLLPEELTEEMGVITPTLKVKRKEVQVMFRDTIDGMYPE